MSISRMRVPLVPDIQDIADDTTFQSEGQFQSKSIWRRLTESVFGSTELRQATRLERDLARGYSINVKQVVLAFLVEFVIIGLILISQFIYAAELPNSTQYKILLALLFPIALAAVELARVPLAIAVRTQNSWNIQFAALCGVACAVVVTSASLYQIGHYTFNPRLENVNEKRNDLMIAREQRKSFDTQKQTSQEVLDLRVKNWNVLADRQKALINQLNQQPNQNCTPIIKREADGSQTTTGQNCRVNPALKTLQTELAEVKTKLNEAESSGRQAQVELAKFDPSLFDSRIRNAEVVYRDAVNQSQLHAYTGMLFGKDAGSVTEGEVKTLEWWLILIPSIAAALSSTLIALTAVRRLKPPQQQPVTTLPDEAAAYLFGPLITAIQEEAKQAVTAALSGGTKPKVSPNASADKQSVS